MEVRCGTFSSNGDAAKLDDCNVTPWEKICRSVVVFDTAFRTSHIEDICVLLSINGLYLPKAAAESAVGVYANVREIDSNKFTLEIRSAGCGSEANISGSYFAFTRW